MRTRNRNPVRHCYDDPNEPRDNYVRVPNAFARGPMHPFTKGIALEILSHADGFGVSVADMAARYGHTWRYIQKHVDELVSARWLVLREYRMSNGNHAFYEYCIRSDRPFTDDEIAELNVPVILQENPSDGPNPNTRGATDSPPAWTPAANTVPSTDDAPICNLCNKPVFDDEWKNGRGSWHLTCLRRKRPDVNWTPDDSWNESPPPRTEHVGV